MPTWGVLQLGVFVELLFPLLFGCLKPFSIIFSTVSPITLFWKGVDIIFKGSYSCKLALPKISSLTVTEFKN